MEPAPGQSLQVGSRSGLGAGRDRESRGGHPEFDVQEDYSSRGTGRHWNLQGLEFKRGDDLAD